MKTNPVAEQLRSELAALSHRTGASETLARDAERITSGNIGGAAATIVGVLFPGQMVPAEWWRTPLGRFCGSDPAGPWRGSAVTQAYAATVLGVAPGTVAALCYRGILGARGKVLLGDVFDRLERLERVK